MLRLVSDDDLDQHPDPAAVLQSWLDSPPPERSSPAPRSTGPSSTPATTPWNTCARSPPGSPHPPRTRDRSDGPAGTLRAQHRPVGGARHRHDFRVRRHQAHLRSAPRLPGRTPARARTS
ncbi:hypothetical protein NKH18_00560 [Streptomyces sp. M10(2022)]